MRVAFPGGRTVRRLPPYLSSINNSSCKLLSVSLFGTQFLNPPHVPTLRAGLDFQLRTVLFPLQFGDARESDHEESYLTRGGENVHIFNAERRYHLRGLG